MLPAAVPPPNPTPIDRLMASEKARFLGAGAVNTVVGVAAFVGLELTLGRVAHYVVVLLVAHVVGVLFAFFVHRRFTFNVHGNFVVDLLRFETVYLGALGVNLLLLPLLVEAVGVPVIPAQITVVFFTAMASYVGHKYFSFRRPAL